MEFLFPLPGGKGSGGIFLLPGRTKSGNYEPAPTVFWEWLLDIKFIKVLFLMSQHKVRDHGDTKTDPGQIQKKIIAGQLCLGSQGKAVADKKLLEKFAGGAGFFQHKNGIFYKLG